MLARSVLVTGSNRGLGLEFIKQIAKSRIPPEILIASCRTPDKALELREVAAQHKNVHILPLDAGDESSHKIFSENVKELVGSQGLNLLINNAGVAPKSTRIDFVKWEQMTETLHINTVAPLMLTKALKPLLATAGASVEGNDLSVGRAAVINISSILGSIEENKQGALYPYRASKAALNAITKSLSIDLRRNNILVSSVHPGWVQTDMGGKNAPLTPSDSIAQMLQLFHSLNETHNGEFYQFDGERLPW